MLILLEKLKKFFNQRKDGSHLGFSTILGSLITAIFGIIVAPIIGVEHYGNVSYFFAIAGIIHAIVSLGASNVILVYLPKGIKLFSTISLIVLVPAIIASIVVYFLFNEISIAVLVIGLIIFELGINEIIAKRLYPTFTKYYLAQRVLFVILALSLYFVFGPAGMILGHGLSMLIVLPRIFKGFKESQIDFSLIKTRMNFVAHNYFLRISRTSYVYLDRIIIFPLFGYVTLGNYELGLQLIALANVLSVIVYQYLQPRDAKSEHTHKIKFFVIIISIIVSIMVILLGPILIPIMFPQFEEVVDLIPILGLSIVPHMVVIIYMSKFLGDEKSRIVLIAALLHFGVQISLIFILGHLFSTLGIAIALVVAETAEAIFLINRHKVLFKTYL
mgnify:CR=1 FL=1